MQILFEKNVAGRLEVGSHRCRWWCCQRRDHPWRWGNISGGDATGGGTTLGGSIDVVPGGGGGIGSGCSSCALANIRGAESLGISDIERGSQFLKSLQSLVIAASCSW